MKTMRDLADLIENEALTGTVSLPMLLKLLPDVTDPNRFRSAMRKLIRNDGQRLSLKEKDEIVNAFTSILKADRNEDMKLMRLLMRIEDKHLQ